MGKGRAPCCDKTQVKRGPWSPAEDLKLIAFIQKYGHENWRALPKQAGLLRCGKSCRLRWINYLRPDVKRGNFTPEEEETIIRLHKALGNKWSKIASGLPGRTDNEIKNVWNTHLKKRLAPKKVSEQVLMNPSQNHQSLPPLPHHLNHFSPMRDQIHQRPPHLVTMNSMTKLRNYQWKIKWTRIQKNNCPTNLLTSLRIQKRHYDVGSILEEVDKPNHLIEIPWEPDYDFWKLLDDDNSLGSFQSNEVQLGEFPAIQNIILGEEGVHDAEAKKWSHDFENEFGVVGGIKESSKDHFLPKNYAVEPEMDHTQAFDFDDIDMARPESELDFGYIQLWPSCPQNNNTSL
uniref:Uncharacterized protein n=1 Tax=Glycine max TaxID=3847 RepID=A0A0R0GES0_SOYBN